MLTMTETMAQPWVPRTLAGIMLAQGLGEAHPVSHYRIMTLVRRGWLECKIVGEGGHPRYYISRASIEKFLSRDG